MSRVTARKPPIYRSAAMADLYMLLALMGLPIVMILFWLLQTSSPNWWSNLTARLPLGQTGQIGSNLTPGQFTTLPDGRKAKVVAVTHQALCEPGRDSLNIRPKASFDNPIAKVPCGQRVAVTGATVVNQGETWSPVVYGTTQGWSVTRLLRKL